MPTIVQFRRGTSLQNNNFTGAAGEISVDSTLHTLRVHDGSTAGGYEIVQLSANQSLSNKTLVSPLISNPELSGIAVFTDETNSSSYSTGSVIFAGGVGIAKTLRVGNDIHVSNDLIVDGNLTINGTTTTINSTITTLDDPILTLGGDTSPLTDDNKDRGIEFRWHNGTNAKVGFFGYDDSTGKFTFIPDASNSSEVFSGTKGTLDAKLEWDDVLNKPSAVSAFTNDSGYLTSYTETDPIYVASSWYSTTNNASNWNTAYGWGNHASAGYQAGDADLTAIAALSGTSGFLKKTAVNTWSLDTNTYLTSYTETDTLDSVTDRGATTTNSITVGGLHATDSVQIDGNLTVSGTTVTINATNLAIEDNMIYLNEGSTVANPDLGIAGNYNDGTYRHAGFFRDATDGYWKVFKNYTPEPDDSAYIDTSHATFALADIQAANFRGALVGNADTVTNGVYTTGSYSNPSWLTSLAYSKLTGAPTLATVATTGSYSDLTGKPTIPSLTSQLTNDSGYLTGITSGQVTGALGYTPYNSTNPNGYISSVPNSSTQVSSLGVGTSASDTTGEIRATNNITAYYSDERLKTRLGNIENALDKVDRLSGFYYEANQTAVDLGYKVKREVGVSAQEVQSVLPEIVTAAPIDDKYLTVYYDRLVPLLIEAIKELRKEIIDIKQTISESK